MRSWCTGAIAINDYTEAAAVVCLFGLAEWLEVRATGRARDAISAIIALKPSTAVLAATGTSTPFRTPFQMPHQKFFQKSLKLFTAVSAATGTSTPCKSPPSQMSCWLPKTRAPLLNFRLQSG